MVDKNENEGYENWDMGKDNPKVCQRSDTFQERMRFHFTKNLLMKHNVWVRFRLPLTGLINHEQNAFETV